MAGMKIAAVVCELVALLSLPGIWDEGWKFYLTMNVIVDAVLISAGLVVNRLAGG